jgi:polyketide biosynthesis acyl carrier protein
MNSQEIFALIVFNIREMVPGLAREQVRPESKLSPLGLDSVGRAELIEKMLEDLQLNVPRQEFHSAKDLEELAQLFAKRVNA